MLDYPHHMTIEGESTGGAQDPDGGYNPGVPGALKYDDHCDAQDNSGGLEINVGETGLEDTSADINIFLKDKDKIYDIEIGNNGTYWNRLDPSRSFKFVIESVNVMNALIGVNSL
jgi:hypothetical protein